MNGPLSLLILTAGLYGAYRLAIFITGSDRRVNEHVEAALDSHRNCPGWCSCHVLLGDDDADGDSPDDQTEQDWLAVAHAVNVVHESNAARARQFLADRAVIESTDWDREYERICREAS